MALKTIGGARLFGRIYNNQLQGNIAGSSKDYIKKITNDRSKTLYFVVYYSKNSRIARLRLKNNRKFIYYVMFLSRIFEIRNNTRVDCLHNIATVRTGYGRNAVVYLQRFFVTEKPYS